MSRTADEAFDGAKKSAQEKTSR